MPPPKLLDQVRAVVRVKHFSLSTERAYVERDPALHSLSPQEAAGSTQQRAGFFNEEPNTV